MLENLNLGYRINRIFNGETGIVESLDKIPQRDDFGELINYCPDDLRKLPMLVNFKNPLGELCTELTPLRPIRSDRLDLSRLNTKDHIRYSYKEYKSGDRFP